MSLLKNYGSYYTTSDQIQYLLSKVNWPKSNIENQNTEKKDAKLGLRRPSFPNEMNMKNCLFQKRSKYLHFVLDKKPFQRTCYKMDKEYQSNFLSKITEARMSSVAVIAQFSKSVNNLPPSPDKQALVEIAKTAVLIAYHFGEAGALNVKKIIAENYGEVAFTNDLVKRMTLIYLIHLIMTIETVSDLSVSPLERSYCKAFEELLSRKGIFRLLVRQVSLHQKEELYSLRSLWELYFSEKGLAEIDRNFFWIYEGSGLLANPINHQEVADETEECEDTDLNVDEDSLSTFNQIIEPFLDSDWLLEFPISEEEKRGFTEKYSSKKPSGSNTVYLYNTRVEFNETVFQDTITEIFRSPDKNKLIEVAKEALYVEKVFGENKAAAVAQLLTKQMTSNDVKGEDGVFTVLSEQLLSLLLVHIILCAEATNDSTKNKTKETRRFCKAFSTNLFVANFQTLVSNLKSKHNKRKLYWMRLVWNSCLTDQYLSKIDNNFFWLRVGIEAGELPERMTLKRKAPVLLPNSNEEVAIIACVDTSKCREEEPVIEIQSSDEDTEECDDEIIFISEKKENQKTTMKIKAEKAIDFVESVGRMNCGTTKNKNVVISGCEPGGKNSFGLKKQPVSGEQDKILPGGMAKNLLLTLKNQNKDIQKLDRMITSLLERHSFVADADASASDAPDKNQKKGKRKITSKLDTNSFSLDADMSGSDTLGLGTSTSNKRKMVTNDLNQQSGAQTKKRKITAAVNSD